MYWYVVHSHSRHGSSSAEAPGYLPDSTSGPDDPFQSCLFVSSQCLPVPLHACCCPSLSSPANSRSPLHPAPLAWPPRSVWTIFVGIVSASSLHPALCGNEDQVRLEKALQRLLLCPQEGTPVCVLQDKPKTQAEAGLNCWECYFVVVDIYKTCAVIINCLLAEKCSYFFTPLVSPM